MSESIEFDKIVARLRPDMESLIRKADSHDSPAALTGIAFYTNPTGLIRFGNILNRGDGLIHVHNILATYAMELEAKNPLLADVAYANIESGVEKPGALPEVLADELAREVLITGMDESRLSKILGLAQDYLIARKGQQPRGQK